MTFRIKIRWNRIDDESTYPFMYHDYPYGYMPLLISARCRINLYWHTDRFISTHTFIGKHYDL